MAGDLILHVGMPRTGTSAIQESLYYGLNNPETLYFSFDETKASATLNALFSADPSDDPRLRLLGWSPEKFADFQRTAEQKLWHALSVATSTHSSLYLSAENCWVMQQSELAAMKRFIEAARLPIRVVAYIRPRHDWLESRFQDYISRGGRNFRVAPLRMDVLNYAERIQTLEQVFGKAWVELFPYAPHLFPDKCVVMHFRRTRELDLPADAIRRTPASLSLPALRLLYAYRQHVPQRRGSKSAVMQNQLLLKQLSALSGPQLRLHPELVAPILDPLQDQLAVVSDRTGVDFPETWHRRDDELCVQSEQDLLNFCDQSLDWLCQVSRMPQIRRGSAEQTAQQVAERVEKLRTAIPLSMTIQWNLDATKRFLRRVAQNI
ncbi:MAG: hypothetical protein ACKO3T_19260 [Planctomycetaceae bacterium]